MFLNKYLISKFFFSLSLHLSLNAYKRNFYLFLVVRVRRNIHWFICYLNLEQVMPTCIFPPIHKIFLVYFASWNLFCLKQLLFLSLKDSTCVRSNLQRLKRDILYSKNCCFYSDSNNYSNSYELLTNKRHMEQLKVKLDFEFYWNDKKIF